MITTESKLRTALIVALAASLMVVLVALLRAVGADLVVN